MRWLQWLVDNPQLLFIVGGAIAYWINERRKAKEGREMAEEADREPDEIEMEERTRRIQEEIRRKIAERQGQPPAVEPSPYELERAPMPPPLPSAPPQLPEARPILVAEEVGSGAAEIERVMEEQRRYAEQLDRLAAAERASQAATPGAVPLTMAVYQQSAEGRAGMPTSRGGERILVGLHDREALRRAIVLREVLGAPKALQR